ncbi:hypothetical protein COCSUDRAFT_64007 [Coccomyxa subellipsoidea C-169]|uniref:Uncharacterized protein n=1 Tax=Coccomyxa subellipsoidea (strain C-169) TaxID=574566 RepID=I0YWW5_COCSC|nr:hypothetical protein COCSUDRAFT_64007 [Coccomyxa subellipsoidea C-169]EIE22884.1 hypothetical protein COCSUDRAFT_64007 [Coccomyxa subellipsoidea C-169]|eukprot:XP_005647428.1 hypothetical protein COCSUDRAFT_64007 [Coccomyxa subellipsoidea C-169]
MRTSVYALDKAINVALYAVSGKLAALLATRGFGFTDPPRDAPLRADPAGNAAAARALQGALLCLLVFPRDAMTLGLNALYLTLPRDRAAAAGIEGGEECQGCKGDASDEECGYVEIARKLAPLNFEASTPFEGRDHFVVTPYRTSCRASGLSRLSQNDSSVLRQALSRPSHDGGYMEAGILPPEAAVQLPEQMTDGRPLFEGESAQ